MHSKIKFTKLLLIKINNKLSLTNKSCEHNTEGEQCERCKPGFIGDATKGTPFDCQPNITQVDDNGCPCNGHFYE